MLQRVLLIETGFYWDLSKKYIGPWTFKRFINWKSLLSLKRTLQIFQPARHVLDWGNTQNQERENFYHCDKTAMWLTGIDSDPEIERKMNRSIITFYVEIRKILNMMYNDMIPPPFQKYLERERRGRFQFIFEYCKNFLKIYKLLL